MGKIAIKVLYGVIVKLNLSNFLKKDINLTCIYLTTQVLPHFKHTSRASKLLLNGSKKMKITWLEIGAVGLRWYIIYRS